MLFKLKITQILVLVLFTVLITGRAFAHCDSENGPVAVDARKALDTGNFNIVAIWVGEDQEQELRNNFEESLAVYKTGGKAKNLAERYFISTAVRLHRTAEGMPFTGVKAAQSLSPVIEQAEQSLETGDPESILNLLSKEMKAETQKWFQRAGDAKKNYNGNDVEAGRKWVDAYVKYVIFVNGLYKTIQAGPEHGVGE